jgi:hypothetical protein
VAHHILAAGEVGGAGLGLWRVGAGGESAQCGEAGGEARQDAAGHGIAPEEGESMVVHGSGYGKPDWALS